MRVVAGAVLAAALSCAACGRVDIPFDDTMAAAARAQLEPGEATIKGSAFLRRAKGTFATAGGEWIYLIPVTPYAQERFRQVYGDRRSLRVVLGYFVQGADPRYAEAMRKVKAHRNGTFRFEKVKPGRYYVATSVAWTDDEDDYIFLRGSLIYEEVEVKQGDEEVEVIVSGK